MPYAVVEDLPADVRDALPLHGQQIFLAAFNEADETSCRDASDREGCSFKIAWAAVGNSYQKNPAGKWTEIQNVASFGNVEAVPASTHDVVLQGLDQWLPTPHTWIPGGKVFFGSKNFEGSEPKWDAVPEIFVSGVPEHPSSEALRANQAAELARIRGRVVGKPTDTKIVKVGTPRMQSKLTFADAEVQNLHAQGFLGQSTGFDCPTFASGQMNGMVEPSHILLFDLRKGSPNDQKTMFLNTKRTGEENMGENDPEMKGILSKLTSALEGLGKSSKETAHANVAVDDSTEKLAERLAEHAKNLEIANTAKATAEAELEAAKAKLAEFANIETKRLADEKEARWLDIKNTLTVGKTYKPEDEAATRAAWEKDPVKFALDLVHESLAKPPAKGAQGATFGNTSPAGASDEQALMDLGYTSLEVSGGGD